jgi:hypothetical protein
MLPPNTTTTQRSRSLEGQLAAVKAELEASSRRNQLLSAKLSEHMVAYGTLEAESFRMKVARAFEIWRGLRIPRRPASSRTVATRRAPCSPFVACRMDPRVPGSCPFPVSFFAFDHRLLLAAGCWLPLPPSPL